jgi:hypothetical protein
MSITSSYQTKQIKIPGSINKNEIGIDYDDDDELQMSLDDELALAENMLNEIQSKINGMGSVIE